MISLPLPHPPASAAELVEGLRAALREIASGSPKVEAEGEWPALQRLAIDLSGARIPATPPRPAEADAGTEGFSVAHLEIKGEPIRYETAQANLSIEAAGARFSLGALAGGKVPVGLTAVERGCFSLSLARAELEKAIQAVATQAAAAQGVDIERVRLNVTAAGPGAVAFQARIIAHKLFMKAAIEVGGHLSVDNALVARLSQLTCTGSGMIGAVASDFLKPHLEKMNNRSFPLAGFGLGETRVTDLQIDPGEPLRVTASFGGKSAA